MRFKHYTIEVALILAICLSCGANVEEAQKRCQDPSASRVIGTEKEAFWNRVDFADAAELKLATRKGAYHPGELITLDLAILNRTKGPIFFHNLDYPSVALRVSDDKGKEIAVQHYATVLEGISAKSFDLRHPNTILINSIQLLVGCNSKELLKFQRARSDLTESERKEPGSYERRLFEQDLFVSWGDACLDLSHPGSYSVVAQITNENVVKSDCEPNVRTAIGTIRSKPLVISLFDN
jgi:hypothetical protein